MVTTLTTLMLLVVTASASTVATSTLATGIKSLITDVSAFLVILCPVVGGCMAVYFVIRRSIADDQDGKMWTKHITTAIICGVAGMVISGIITLISSYF